MVFKQGELEAFFGAAASDVEGALTGVTGGEEHGGGESQWDGGEVLDLAESPAAVDEIAAEREGIIGRGAGVGADEIGDEELFLAGAAVGAGEAVFEFLKEFEGWFSHELEDMGTAMFGRDFEVASDEAAYEQVQVVGAGEGEVMADAGGDEDVCFGGGFTGPAEEGFHQGDQ